MNDTDTAGMNCLQAAPATSHHGAETPYACT